MSKRKATPAEGIHLRHGKRCQSRDAVIVARGRDPACGAAIVRCSTAFTRGSTSGAWL